MWLVHTDWFVCVDESTMQAIQTEVIPSSLSVGGQAKLDFCRPCKKNLLTLEIIRR